MSITQPKKDGFIASGLLSVRYVSSIRWMTTAMAPRQQQSRHGPRADGTTTSRQG